MAANLEEIFDSVDVSEIVASSNQARKLLNQSEGYDVRQYKHWQNHLINLYISAVKWEGLPAGIDPRAVEYTLMTYGCGALFMEDGGHLFGAASNQNGLNINYNPVEVLITSPNGAIGPWTRHTVPWVADGVVMDADCALCWDNMTRTPVLSDINYYARRLARIDRIIDVNSEAQLTPYIIVGSDAQEMNSRQIIDKLRSHSQFITYNNQLGDIGDTIQVLQTNAPYMGDVLYKLKKDLVSEFLTSIGIDNDPNADKMQHRPVAEVIQNNEQVMIARRARLEPRRQFARKCFELFGLELSVEWGAVHETAETEPAVALDMYASNDPNKGNPYANI